MRIPSDQLLGIAIGLLESRGVPIDAARLQADLLIEAELRGLASHGIQRLPRLLTRIERRLADPTSRGEMAWSAPCFLSVDGKQGLGPIVMLSALDALRERVASQGIAAAGIRNANHIGMLAYYAEATARKGLIGIFMSSSEALVHPYGGTEALLGTNPIAVGIPTDNEPFLLDFATSVVSMGKIHHHALRGEPIPEHWAVDVTGKSTTDARLAMSGAIAPFGGVKGYGLGLAVELLVGMLTGSPFAPEIHGTLDDTSLSNKGDLIVLIDPSAGQGSAAAIAAYITRLRNSRPLDTDHPVSAPGDGGRRRRARISRDGIDVPDVLWDQLQHLRAA